MTTIENKVKSRVFSLLKGNHFFGKPLFRRRAAYDAGGMEGLIKRLAEASDITPAEAADHIDKLIDRILKRLRQGNSVRVRGLGKFSPGPSVEFQPEKRNDSSTGSRGSSRRGR